MEGGGRKLDIGAARTSIRGESGIQVGGLGPASATDCPPCALVCSERGEHSSLGTDRLRSMVYNSLPRSSVIANGRRVHGARRARGSLVAQGGRADEGGDVRGGSSFARSLKRSRRARDSRRRKGRVRSSPGAKNWLDGRLADERCRKGTGVSEACCDPPQCRITQPPYHGRAGCARGATTYRHGV